VFPSRIRRGDRTHLYPTNSLRRDSFDKSTITTPSPSPPAVRSPNPATRGRCVASNWEHKAQKVCFFSVRRRKNAGIRLVFRRLGPGALLSLELRTEPRRMAMNRPVELLRGSVTTTRQRRSPSRRRHLYGAGRGAQHRPDRPTEPTPPSCLSRGSMAARSQPPQSSTPRRD
jgi:hypothetical protein